MSHALFDIECHLVSNDEYDIENMTLVKSLTWCLYNCWDLSNKTCWSNLSYNMFLNENMKIPFYIFSFLNLENPLYIWYMRRKQKIMPKFLFIHWNDIFFGPSDWMNIMQNGYPIAYLTQLLLCLNIRR